MLDHTYSFHFKVVPDKINDMLDHACIYICLPACCVCMSEISVLDAHPEQKWILAHSLNGLEEVGTDFLVSLATEQHAALHVCMYIKEISQPVQLILATMHTHTVFMSS